ncbi:16S rRNA (cytosine(967)-C(5))-methyltransferase RsmB [Arsenophonus symbiont of Ornithomya chloropus]|uniref:16S rRNA (cytosine(967)-C(5))-methyltransferase RsmB n=1 Tax=Arsenophonus symbiont of Ornithomya chloropus TaxID=634121 RepID=UPI0032B179E4
MHKKNNVRSICAQIILQVMDQKKTLNSALIKYKKKLSDKDKALLQELSFGILRVLPMLQWFIQQLIKKPLHKKKQIINYLIMVGIYQLNFTRIPSYAVINETVNGAILLKNSKLKKFINAVLRAFQRQRKKLNKKIKNKKNNHLHPQWLLKKIQKAYPYHWKKIITENNQKPPMWIRVNQLYHSTHQYYELLKISNISATLSKDCLSAIKLNQPCKINQLPGFDQGWITIQDISSQKCVELLNPKNHEYILDLCAAPGGKTTHILEIAPKAYVLAVDINKSRIQYIKDNFNRLKLHAKIIVGDGRYPEKWITSEKKFDRILLDLPCSASGVIRRHPDIKWIKNPTEILNLIKLQYEILEAIWPYLKNQGTLVYSTCSILPDENQKQIKKFLFYYKEAYLKYDIGWGTQILPTKNGGDGFFYTSLVKK